MPRIPKQPGCDCHVPVSASEDIKLKILESNFDQKLTTKQDKLEAGPNIKIDSANKISGVLTETITTNVTVGGIPAGTTLTKNTSLDEILKNIFTAPEPTEVVLRKGIVTAIPTSVAGLVTVETNKEALLASGYDYESITTNNQYAVLAVPKSAGISCYDIKVYGFSMGFITKDLGDHFLYHFELPTTEQNACYTYLFKEG